MGTKKQQTKQGKRERKAAKEAAREAARQEERRRQLVTLAIVVAIAVVGGGLAVWLVLDERRELAAAEDGLERILDDFEQYAGTEATDAILANLEQIPPEQILAFSDDEDVDTALEEFREEQEALLAELYEEEQAIADRPVACGADEPAAAGEEREPYDEDPPEVLDGEMVVRATLATSCGDLVLELDADAAPETVNAFVFLAEDGFYDGREVFRHAEGIEVLQTGSGTDDAAWDVGFDLPGELDRAEELGYPAGTVAVANPGDPDRGGSQFFLVYGEAFDEAFGEDEPAYTNFGEVVEGLDVLTELADIGVIGGQAGAEVPAERIYLESVTIERGE